MQRTLPLFTFLDIYSWLSPYLMRMETAIAYIRVSTEDQAREGISLEAQEGRIRSWCEVHGFELTGIYIEALSGGRADNRPELQAALDLACKTKGALVVYSLSRLARSTKDAILISERLDRAGADLVSLSERIDTTSAAGKMVFRMLAVLSEFERDLIRERTEAAMSHLRKHKRRISGLIPYGFELGDDGMSLLDVEEEQQAIGLMKALRSDGMSLRKIAADLEERAIPTKTGAKWSAPTVKAILDRERKVA